jgi:adenylosuccinate lyase
MICEAIVGVTRLARQQVALALEGMTVEHERDWALAQMEWGYVPETCMLTAGALSQMNRVISGLIVYPERMAANVNLLNGLILSEAVMLELALSVGRQSAHEVVYRASMRAYEENLPLKESLMREPEIRDHLEPEAMERLLDPARYTGLAGVFVDRVVSWIRTGKELE